MKKNFSYSLINSFLTHYTTGKERTETGSQTRTHTPSKTSTIITSRTEVLSAKYDQISTLIHLDKCKKGSETWDNTNISCANS